MTRIILVKSLDPYVSAVIGAGLERFQSDLASDPAEAAAAARADAVLSAAESIGNARRDREIAGSGLAWASIAGPAWSAAAAGSVHSAAVSKAAVDLTRALNAVQTGFVDAPTEG